MKKRQNTKGNIAPAKQKGNRKRNTGKKIVSRSGYRETLDKITGKKPVRVKAGSKAAEKEIMEYYPMQILKTCKDLNVICIKIKELEIEKQKLLDIIINDVPKMNM